MGKILNLFCMFNLWLDLLLFYHSDILLFIHWQTIKQKTKTNKGVVVNQMPLEAKLFLLFSYLIGSFLGGCVATIFSDGTRPVPRESLLVGSFFTFSNVANLYAIPHPLWMSIASMSIFIPAAVAGGTIFRSIFGQKPKENEFIQHQQQHQKNQQHLIKKKKWMDWIEAWDVCIIKKGKNVITFVFGQMNDFVRF